MYNRERERENHGPAELIEEAKHGEGVGDLESWISILPFAKKVLRDVYTVYIREGHFERDNIANPRDKKIHCEEVDHGEGWQSGRDANIWVFMGK